MDQCSTQNERPTLKEVQKQFKTWRKIRKKKTAIPDKLWEAAVTLSSEYTLYQISKALRLNYNDLKHRVKISKPVFQPPTHSGPAFIELGLNDQMLPAECIIEMEDRDGGKMRMHFKGNAGLDLLELSKAFWNKRS